MGLFDTGIRPAIDDYLTKLAQEKRDYGDYWSASSAGYCMRKNIFDRLGVPSLNDDPRKQRVFSAGHIFHDWIQGITKEAGLSIASEVELQDEDLMIRGHFDDLVLVNQYEDLGGSSTEVNLGIKQNLILYDYKTKHSQWFSYVKEGPMSHYHRLQLGTYMYMIRNVKEGKVALFNELVKRHGGITPELSEARILSISKDDLRMHEEQLMWSPELQTEVLRYWKDLNLYWNEKKMPECTCGLYEVNKKTGVGFMADPRFNPYYFNGEPCSIEYYEQWKADQ